MEYNITDATFEQETKNGLVLVDFWATWCGPCRMQAPILEQLAKEVDESQLKITKIEVDENPSTPSDFSVMSIPTLVFLKDGKEVKRLVGVQSKEKLKAVMNELA